uniref:Pept_C1 domain-containing protein n=1 Tax=Syphacia muris TaxID=451379 RepID=A0A0N5ASP0_9BILA
MYELENRRMQPSFNYSPYADSFGKSERFSELELLLCYGKGDCRDRSTQNVFEYAAKHGLLPERQMNQNSMCWPETQFQFNTLYSIQSDEESIKSYIVNHGPVILHLYLPVNVLKDYIGDDVIAPFPECDGKKPNHAMLAIGYGVQNGVKYWLLQNSWGLDWGNMGYVKWRRGIDACSVESSPIGASFLKNW